MLPAAREVVERFQGARTSAEGVAIIDSGAPLGHVAQDAGDYDPSHFIRDFRRFAGVTPGELRRQR